MRSVGIYDARAQLGELVRSAAAGEEIVINVHGKPTAKLVSATNKRERSTVAARRFIARVKHRRPMSDAEIRELIEEGRRH